ncbi:arylsulfatase [Peredibacter sp. HCB2-198]|uniref:arylsulfatase n=1 Tax=Peredibacter sp. HCB2-198 TaxID=3383025 RepID=UPI0038B55317
MKKTVILFLSLFPLSSFSQAEIPFPPVPSASKAGPTIEKSVHKRREKPNHLFKDAPNILIILLDDTGPGLPSTYGGEVNTPTLTKIAQTGISYNRFHSTSMCSPTRASLLTGRNHNRVGNGQIAELSNDWDGFSGVIPKSAATVAEVLKDYGYSTAAFGKWHNTPADETSKSGPFDNWPTGYGFEYFYGFLAGESSQYEPNLVKNTTYVDPPKTPGKTYHLSEDLAENAIAWLRDHRAIHPDKPFFMYWAPGASHGPQQIMNDWADKYKSKFDDGWDKYRERVFARMKEMKWIPENTQLTPRPSTLSSWESIPENQKPFQRRLMEIFAGFTEHADAQAGKVVAEIERLGVRENTLIFYIWGDNGSSAEGQQGTISEFLTQNQIPTKIEDHLQILEKLGGMPQLGTAKTDNMYHAGWAWAGSTPYKGTKLMGAYFGGTRQPMAVSWPKKIAADSVPRTQFHHVNDIAPTIYDILKISPPKKVNGVKQLPLDGVSFAYSFNDSKEKGRKKTQYFDIMASRGIYHDGWMASTFGPRVPWMTVTPGMATWTPEKDQWELYHLDADFSQANDLAGKYPDKLRQMKDLFMSESKKNLNMPIGGGLLFAFRPETVIQNPNDHFVFSGDFNRLPEFSAPKIGTRANLMTFDLEIPKKGEGVLLALGGFSGGISLFMKEGKLHYEYNTLQLERSKFSGAVPNGKVKLEVELRPKKLIYTSDNKKLQSADVLIKANGKKIIEGEIPTIVNLAFTANDTFDVGTDLGSPVSLDYYDAAPFKFNGSIHLVDIRYLDVPPKTKKTTMR